MGTGSLVKRSNTGQGGTLSKQIHLLNLFPYLHACEVPSLPCHSCGLRVYKTVYCHKAVFSDGHFWAFASRLLPICTNVFSHHYCCTHFLHSLPVTRQPSFGEYRSAELPHLGPCYSLWTCGLPL